MPCVPERYVNLDYAASAPLRREAFEAFSAYDKSAFAGANPNSLHSLGRAAAASLEGARRDVAKSLGARVRPSEVVFTGGGTEANHLALLGIAEGVRERERGRTRVVVSAIEHDSVLDNVALLRARGFAVDVVGAASDGRVHPDALEALLGDNVALVSVMLANNETGAVQPVRELACAAHACGARFHTDAIQGYLHLPFDVDELGVDALSLAGHKVGAPVGIGALYLRGRTPLKAQVMGGGQEAGRRAGTQDVRAALALAAVARILGTRTAELEPVLRERADALYRRLLANPRIQATLPDVLSAKRLPGIVSITVEGVESEELILKLDARGFEVSAASACASGSLQASHVLLAMGIPSERAYGSLRISFDERVEPCDLDAFADALLDVIGSR